MGEPGRRLLVGVALGIALGVTLLFTVGFPLLEAGQADVPIENTAAGTPSPSTSPSSPSTSTNLSYDPGAPPDSVTDFATFENVAAELGFEYSSIFRGTGTITRSGVYVVDFNNNGYEDVLAIGGEQPVLFENVEGEFRPVKEFEHSQARSAHFFDATNNGYRDLVFAEYGGSIVFYANEGGTFTEREVGLEKSLRSPVAIESADFTGNGCLDLLITQNGHWQSGHAMPSAHAREVAERHPTIRPEPSDGGENYLFYNHDDCTRFTDQTERAGIAGANWTLAVSAADFTGNGYPDIHVGNDFGADILYTNRGNGTFDATDLGPDTDRNAMASVPFDANGNHQLDLFVTNIYFPEGVESTVQEIPLLSTVPEGNNLLINQNGTGEFVDEAPIHDLHRGGWGWAAAIADFTNDGHLDIIHGTSREVPVDPYDEYRGKMVWKGTADSWERENGTELGFGIYESRGLVQLDIANTGVLDVAVAASSAHQRDGSGREAFGLYENQHTNDESLQLFVRNPDGVERHAAVYVHTDQRTIFRPVTSGSDFLSQNSRLLHFGLAAEELEAVTVVWPDGTESVFEDLTVGNRYIVTPDDLERVD